MAGGGKDLIANIIINGRTTDGFSRMSRQLSQMAQQVDQFGSGVRRFETESLSIYQDYETNMLAAKAALSAQYRNAGELNKVMSTLDVNARKWASTTIFHTDDVAQAINEASHAGWDLEQQMEGIPRAMTLAQAGGLDLSTGLDYLVKGLNATGTEFKDSGQFIDQWTMAANSSATNIDEIGQALQSLGSAGRFADSTAELFTMLGTLANVGTTGSQAGTLLRSSMIRLIAPTDKALKTMNALAVTEEELGEVSANMAGLTEANQLLEEAGFSAYDSNGELKGFLEIYSDLYSAVSGMEEVDKNKVLSAIFPTRTMSTALTLLQGAADSWNGLYESILGSDGYAQQNADIMMSGLMGATETLKSKWEEFQRMFGGVLAPWVEDGAAALGGIIDGLNSMDPNVLSGLAGAATALSLAGPSLMLVAGASKAIALLGTPGGQLALAAMALGAIAGYVSEVEKSEWTDNFGAVEIDIGELNSYLSSLTSEFTAQKAAVDEWGTQVAASFDTYETASGDLMSRITNGVITNHTFTPEEIQQLNDLGDTMINAVYDGIDNAEARDLTAMDILLGKAQTAEEEAAITDAMLVTGNRYDSLKAQAAQIGKELRDQMTAALTDHVLDAQEREAIEATTARLNEIEAQIMSERSKADYYKQLYKAGHVSWDSASGAMQSTNDSMREAEENIRDLYAELIGQTMASYDAELEKAVNDEQRMEIRQRRDAAIATYETMMQRDIDENTGNFGTVMRTIMDTLMEGSDLGEAWRAIKAIAPYASTDEQGNFVYKNLPSNFWQSIGADETMAGQLAELASNPYTRQLMKLMQPYIGTDENMDAIYRVLASETGDSGMPGLADAARYSIESARGSNREVISGEALTANVETSKQTAAASGIAQMLASTGDTSDAPTIMVRFGVDEETANAVVAERDAMQAAYDVPLEASVRITNAYEAGIAAKAAMLSAIGTLSVGFGLSSGRGAGTRAYANGGRATEASIFGEAGAEWAIPEAHTPRTGELLNAARAASGFTWGELIERYGGLNGGGGQTNITYAPVIHAANADGVASVLEKDKDRMRRVIRDMMMEQREMDGAAAFA